MTSKVKAFGPRLKWWREHRGLSQLVLAGSAETSQRHLSFLESGRAEPNREMVLRLCAVLDVPLRQHAARSRCRPCRSGPWRSRRCSAPSR